MAFNSAVIFFSVIGTMIVVSAASTWPRTTHDYEERQLKYKDKLPTKIEQFYNEDGSIKKHYLEFRPAECDRRGMIGVRPSTRLAWCPTPYLNDIWEWKCIRYEDLCNGKSDCPNGEDERHDFCFHVKLQKEKMDKIRNKVEEMYEKTEYIINEAFKEPSRRK